MALMYKDASREDKFRVGRLAKTTPGSLADLLVECLGRFA